MNLIAVDPAKSKPIAIAEFCGQPLTLNNLYSIPLASLLHNPPWWKFWNADPDKVAVIEHPYCTRYGKVNIDFAVAVGEIRQAIRSLGFKIVPVYAAYGPKGSNSWVRDMFSYRGRAPKREQVKAMSMQLARSEFPGFTFTEDQADATCMGLWYLDRLTRQTWGGDDDT